MLKFNQVLAFVAVLLCTLLVAFIDAARPKWHQLEGYTFEQYIADFGKPYKAGTSEHKMRHHLFNQRIKMFKEHNTNKQHTWKMGVNMFTDMTKAEFKRLNGFKKSPSRDAPQKVHTVESMTPPGWIAPKAVDWREKGLGMPVRHQGSCGSCWAHSGISSLSDQLFLVTGKKSVLSVGQMNSCTPPPGSYGCDGGDYAAGWSYVNKSGIPITEEWAYPYEDFFFPTTGNPKTAACYNISSKFPNKQPYNWFADLMQAGVLGYNSITVNDGAAAVAALAMIGTQSVSVAAGNWQWYEEGIFQNTAANGEDNEWSVDHAVQMIGYGVETAVDPSNKAGTRTGYFIVRNSWSTLWGENGYIRLWRALPEEGQKEPCSPAKYGPVCGTSGVLSDLQYPLVYEAKPLPF